MDTSVIFLIQSHHIYFNVSIFIERTIQTKKWSFTILLKKIDDSLQVAFN